jgi:hypothetical protein
VKAGASRRSLARRRTSSNRSQLRLAGQHQITLP